MSINPHFLLIIVTFLKLNSNDPAKITFGNIDWYFIHSSVREKYKHSPQRAEEESNL
jgi:hypothetical protein